MQDPYNPRCGGSSLKMEKCPGCGTSFECYRGGSWDHEKKYCDKCISFQLENEFEELKEKGLLADIFRKVDELKDEEVDMGVGDLKKQRAKLDAEIKALEEAEKMPLPYKELNDITDDRKIQVFNKLYKTSRSYFKTRLEEGSVAVEDYRHWFEEEVLINCLGPKVFEYLNKVGKS